MALFTCPFCMCQYEKKEILHVCAVCGKVIKKPGVFAKEPYKCDAPNCSGKATIRKCPKCDSVIPRTALETPYFPFSIVGVTNAGKTNYITVMLHELGKATELRLALCHLTNETLTIFRDNCKAIFDDRIPLENSEKGHPKPLIWSVKNVGRRHGDNVPTYTFTIFDGAGEEQENELRPEDPVFRYINASKAIILVIDPLVLYSVRRGNVVSEDVMQESLGGDMGETRYAQDVLNSVATYIKTARNYKANKRLDVPVAIVLTKFDTIISHWGFGSQAMIKNDSLTVKDGKIDLAEIRQVDSEIRYWLTAIGEGSFIDVVESHFSDYCFFGVSSLGGAPVNGVLPEVIKPHRVLDPILWLFKKAHFIE